MEFSLKSDRVTWRGKLTGWEVEKGVNLSAVSLRDVIKRDGIEFCRWCEVMLSWERSSHIKDAPNPGTSIRKLSRQDAEHAGDPHGCCQHCQGKPLLWC